MDPEVVIPRFLWACCNLSEKNTWKKHKCHIFYHIFYTVSICLSFDCCSFHFNSLLHPLFCNGLMAPAGELAPPAVHLDTIIFFCRNSVKMLLPIWLKPDYWAPQIVPEVSPDMLNFSLTAFSITTTTTCIDSRICPPMLTLPDPILKMLHLHRL